MSNGGCQRLLLALTIFFICTTIVAVAVLIWREFRRENETELAYYMRVKNKYPGRFRTTEEQANFSRLMENPSRLRPVNQTITTQSYCNSDCVLQGGKPIRRKRAVSNNIFHSCCVSSTSFDSPNTKLNINGVMRTLVHFPQIRQYFKIQSCSQAIGCIGCTCNLEDDLHTAVVLRAGISLEQAEELEDTELDFFYFQGCCKCLNNGVAP